MKLKVIAKIMDGVIACNKTNIVCFHESSIQDDKGEHSLYWSNEGIPVGRILTNKNIHDADTYWWYTKKQWDSMNKEFQKIKV
jgi:hypothetical protein